MLEAKRRGGNMKLNKRALKEWSTWATGVSMVIGGVTAYLPQIVPEYALPYVLISCAAVIAACRFIKQGGLEGLVDDSTTNSND